MTLAAFLPACSAEHIVSAVPNEELLLAKSWIELDSVIRQRTLNGVVLDPAADGSLNLGAVIGLIRTHRSTPLVAYVPLSEPSLKAIFTLSRHGLSQAIIHPLKRGEFRKTVEMLTATRLAGEFLSFIEAPLGRLRPSILATVQDLFERPHRYESAADIALQAETSVRQVYRDFQRAELEPPKKLVISAKLLRGYSYLRYHRYPTPAVVRKLGYSHTRTFAEHTATVFGCSPSQFRDQSNGDEVVKQLLEWFFKPHFNIRQASAQQNQ